MKPHNEQELFVNKKEFQLERFILFSDAVFAIAITLLVIEIKVPTLEEVNPANVAKMLREKLPEFFGFALSFAVIGQFWISHHRLFGYVTNYTKGLIWLNLYILFWIVLVPFTSGLNSHYAGLNEIWILYSFNLLMISLGFYFMAKYIGNKKRNISTIANQPVIKKYINYRNGATAIIFLLAIVLCLMDWVPAAWAARFIYLAIPFVISIINKASQKANSTLNLDRQ